MTLFVYTSEVYPTRLRGTAFGVFGMDGYAGNSCKGSKDSKQTTHTDWSREC